MSDTLPPRPAARNSLRARERRLLGLAALRLAALAHVVSRPPVTAAVVALDGPRRQRPAARRVILDEPAAAAALRLLGMGPVLRGAA